MSRKVRVALRCVALIAVFPLVPALVSPTAPASGPYRSALSHLGAASALAASTCNNKACTQASHGLKFTCVASPGTNCKTVHGGQDCAVSTC